MTVREDSEAGFTLMELLIVISIIGIIAPVIMGGITIGLKTTSATANRVSNSHDEQLLSVYLPADIQSVKSAGAVDTSGTQLTCSPVAPVLRLTWDEQADLAQAPVNYEAAYSLQQTDGQWQLTRYYCVNAGLVTHTVVARNLSGASAASVAVADPRVSLTLTGAQALHDSSTFTYTISATRRTGGVA